MTSRELFALLCRLAGVVLLADSLEPLTWMLAHQGAGESWLLLVAVVPGVVLVLAAGAIARAFPWPDGDGTSEGAARDEWRRLGYRVVGLFFVLSAAHGVARFVVEPRAGALLHPGLLLVGAGVLLVASLRRDRSPA
jgi:hypothetical protein